MVAEENFSLLASSHFGPLLATDVTSAARTTNSWRLDVGPCGHGGIKAHLTQAGLYATWDAPEIERVLLLQPIIGLEPGSAGRSARLEALFSLAPGIGALQKVSILAWRPGAVGEPRSIQEIDYTLEFIGDTARLSADIVIEPATDAERHTLCFEFGAAEGSFEARRVSFKSTRQIGAPQKRPTLPASYSGDLAFPPKTFDRCDHDMRAPAVRRTRPMDMVFFWKQNDTGIYGRRHDMLLKGLARHEAVGRIIQIDAPVSISRLGRARFDDAAFLDQENLVLSNIVSRHLKAADEGKVAKRVYVHGEAHRVSDFLGAELPPIEGYAGWVRQTMADLGLSQDSISWVAPVSPHYPQVHDAIKFSLSVADIIDDERAMSDVTAHRQSKEANYVDILSRMDVVFANCQAAADAFSFIRDDITVVTNAAEPFSGETLIAPADLAALRGPIIGYVGNLRSRLDVDLIEQMARSRPTWNIVLVGSAHGSPEILRLRGITNVHFLGVRRAEEAQRYVRHFDVAVMPHLDNELSRSMNPLKLFVYGASGVPVVTTRVANIEESVGKAGVADGPDDFIALVEQSLESSSARAAAGHPDLAHAMTWDARIDDIMDVLLERYHGGLGRG